LTFIPLLGILMTLLISFSILGLLATNVTILNIVPNVMLSLGLGIGVDYSLFLLSRFNEERKKNVDVPEAIDSMLTHAGHTILVSGLTLAISFTGLIIFPISVFSSVGIAITITVLVSLAINLTFVPALLRFAGRWLTPYKQTDVKSTSKENSSYWKNFANFSTKYAIPILVIITIIAIPVSVQTFNMTQSLDTFEMLPENLESREGYEMLLNEFDAGLISPMTMVFKSSDINGVWSEEFFNTSQELIQDMINTGDVDGEKIMCHTWMRGEAIPYPLASAAMYIATLNETEKMAALAYYPAETHTVLLLYPAFATEFVNENGSIAILPIVLSIDPFSPEAHDWIIDVRDNILPSFNEFESYDIHIGGLSATLVDVSEVTYSYFPIMILTVLLLIAFLVGFMYKSVFVPIRLLATILLTISFNYGLAVLFFEGHWGAFLKPSINDLTGLFFMVPVMTFSILIGLGMDYDLFILGRIKEGVWNGKSTKEAIADALHHTGSVVTGAALIMVLAFGGLMLSSSMMLVELGFLLAIAVAIDATIVRILLVPAIMSLAEKTNWWPSKIPQSP
jgi:RND superfamily putative drug exporter